MIGIDEGLRMFDGAILYVDEQESCDELKKKLEQNQISFKEWKVKRSSVEFLLPVLITGKGVYSGEQILKFGSDLQTLLAV